MAPPPPKRTKDDTRRENRELLAAALESTIPGQYEEVDECAYLSSVAFPPALIRRLQSYLPGQTFALGDTGGVIWQRGSNGPHGYILSNPATVHKVQRIHRLLVETIPAEQLRSRIMPYTYGSCGGAFIRWVGFEQMPLARMERRLTDESGHAYRYAKPGRYEGMAYWDVVQFYPSLLRRLPSPNVLITGRLDRPSETRVYCTKLEPEMQERWEIAVRQVCHNKDLYTAFVGKMHGSRKKQHQQNYARRSDGSVYDFRTDGNPGKMAMAGRLLVRVGYELTQAAARETGSVWSHTDCVICPINNQPRPWIDFGLKVEIKPGAVGEAHIIDQGDYKVGTRKTKRYNSASIGIPESVDLEQLGLTPTALAFERAKRDAAHRADLDDEADGVPYENEPGDNKLSVLYHKLVSWL